MFKKDDKVVCINDKYIASDINNITIKVDNVYTVRETLDSVDGEYIAVDEFLQFFSINKFISLLNYRKMKIKKICSRKKI